MPLYNDAMWSTGLQVPGYLSYWARIVAAILLPFCANTALAQSSLFTLSGIFPVGSGTNTSVASPGMLVADFNRDGNADIVTANHNDGTLTLLLGDGKANFAPAPGGPDPSTGRVGARDCDGRLQWRWKSGLGSCGRRDGTLARRR